MNPFLQLSVSLGVFPHFDALPLDSEEWQFDVQVDLCRVARLTSAPLGRQNVTLSSRKEAKVYAGTLELKIHRTDHFHDLLSIETPKSDSVAATDFERTGLKHHKHGARLVKAELQMTAALGRIAQSSSFTRSKGSTSFVCMPDLRHPSRSSSWSKQHRQVIGPWNDRILHADSLLPVPQANLARSFLCQTTLGIQVILELSIPIEIYTQEAFAVRSEGQGVDIMLMADEIDFGIAHQIINNYHAAGGVGHHRLRRVQYRDGP